MSSSANQNSAELHIHVEGTPPGLTPMVWDEAYRIAAEALRNAIRYSGARHIEVEIRYDEQQLRLRIRDDGKGIDPGILDQVRKSLNLRELKNCTLRTFFQRDCVHRIRGFKT
ncbi:MAG TPA: ATP-binding protein [Candidatus Angelobacter sp.]|nr:ATP-binding protein [Candidatus Angelobacter sp.]